MITWEETDRKLREAAQLWALGRKLPHVPTPREQALLLDLSVAQFCGDSLSFSREAAVAELRSSWAAGHFESIVHFARSLSEEHLRDLEIRTYVKLAQRVLQARG